jgi:hypothetical protein
MPQASSVYSGINPANITIWPPIYDVQAATGTVTEHDYRLIGKIHPHNSLTDG